MSSLILRVEATQKTVDAFARRPLVWGEADCARVTIAHLAHMSRPSPLKGLTRWTTEKGALRAFRTLGLDDLGEGLDQAGYARVPLAEKLPGDLLGFPGEAPWKTALGVYVGAGQALGLAYGQWLVGSAAVAETCWRVDPWPK